jgi:hypothetical protein
MPWSAGGTIWIALPVASWRSQMLWRPSSSCE